MSRVILVYGQPAAGKSYSLRNLDPKTTFILDADTKGALPWRGWKKNYSSNNFRPVDDLDKILTAIKTVGAKDNNYAHIKTLVIDGLNTAMVMAEVFSADKSYNKWTELGQKILRIIQVAKRQRADLTIVITAHVDNADPTVDNAIDKVKTPGKMIDKIAMESLLLYVLYAKAIEGEYFFETQPNHSSARSPEGCFETKIPNDMQLVINKIESYESGENVGN